MGFIENVNRVANSLEEIKATPDVLAQIEVNTASSLSYKNSAEIAASASTSSALNASSSAAEAMRTKEELIAMKEHFGLAVRTEKATVMVDGYGRYFLQATLTPYGDVLVATVDDGDNDIDIIDGVTTDRELKRFYVTEEILLGKEIIFKYLGSAIDTPLSQYLKDTIDALELLDYKYSIDSYATSKIADTSTVIDNYTLSKTNEITLYGNALATKFVEDVDSKVAQSKSEFQDYVEASLTTAVENAIAPSIETAKQDVTNSITNIINNKVTTASSEFEATLNDITSAELEALKNDYIASLAFSFGTIEEFEAGLNQS